MGHFYDRNGTPRYFVTAKAGHERPSTLADARKQGWVPSVTEILQVIDKPALTNWKVDQAILAALTMPRGVGQSEEDYLQEVKMDSQRQAVEAAAEGTRIHDAIECSFAGKAFPERYEPHVAAVRIELEKNFPNVHDWISEQSFAHPLGFGGKVDLHSPSTGLVIDFKGKDFGPDDPPKRFAYDQNIQLAAYAVGLNLDSKQNPCANIFVSRTSPGRVVSHIWPNYQIHGTGWDIFEAALTLWKSIKQYDASWTP